MVDDSGLHKDVLAAIHDLFREHEEITSSQLGESLDVSRQSAHAYLAAGVEAGLLVRRGKGRSTRYALVESSFRRTYALDGLEEHRVWQELVKDAPQLREIADEELDVLAYATTELINNAIDHSGGTEVDVAVDRRGSVVGLDIRDDGEGVFEHLKEGKSLETDLEAIEELSKGKTTTDPSRHTGEGIFFSSKAVERFRLESGLFAWHVDNELGEHAILQRDESLDGTLVRIELDVDREHDLAALFRRYTTDHEFVKTEILVKLFEYGKTFVSRSEAKRLLRGLEKFQDVTLDFAGVRGIGQGFADEVFRVWPAQHPNVRILATGMNDAIEFMVTRARQRGAETD